MKHPQRKRSKTALTEAVSPVSEIASDLQTIGQRSKALLIALLVSLDIANEF